MTSIKIYDKSLVCLVGSSGSGKSTFAARHFGHTEVLSSDHFRAMVCDDPNDQLATFQAFACLQRVAAARLSIGRLTAVDATSLRRHDRAVFLAMARERDLPALAIVLNPGLDVCLARTEARRDRPPGMAKVVRDHHRLLNQTLRDIGREGFERVVLLEGPEEIEAVEINKVPLPCDRTFDSGPFDVVGDVHGCLDELADILGLLGYEVDRGELTVGSPRGRRVIFLGDLNDRGPETASVLRLAMGMVAAGTALLVPGNHEIKLLRHLRGQDVKISHGFDKTLDSLKGAGPEFLEGLAAFLEALPSHYVLDGGKLVVAHAGLKERYQGRFSPRERRFCLFGETAGELDGYGLPVRLDWTAGYRGGALVLYGHMPALEVRRNNNTVCLDTGCVFGGSLSAWRYPENELVQAPARKKWYPPVRPLEEPSSRAGGK
ncbi:MAG: AAA family ATPase [Deltaproteobacteria bacterium]|jgi:polynucleotide kinase-phosphatase|nr:AAA family ATPase [Deltaproteobacteria bacterium]